MTSERANPFGSLDDFLPKEKATPRPDPRVIETVAQENRFASRGPAPQAPRGEPRRRRTGRNQQINIKATAETIARLYAAADRENLALGELLEKALEAYEKQPRS